MADMVKVTVKAGRSIALGGKFLTGEAEVPADKVAMLVGKKLIEAPVTLAAEPISAASPEDEAPAQTSDDASDAEAADTKKAAKKGKK